jgi:PAS domain S-box-containing protein
MLKTHDQVTHRQEVLKEIQEVSARMTELSNSERAYTIIGDESLLKEREQTKAAVTEKLGDLRKLTSDNPKQQRNLDRLEVLISKRIDFEQSVIDAGRKQGLTAATQMIATRTGLNLSKEISGIFTEMQTEEYRLLDTDRRDAQLASMATFLLLPMGIFLSIAILSLAVSFLNAGMGERVKSMLALRKSEAQLQTVVENLDEGVIVSDLSGRLLHWNRAAHELHGYSNSEQDRRRFTDLVDTFELTTLEDVVVPVEEWPLARILRGERLHDVELRVHRLGSDWRRIFNYGGTLVQDDNHNPIMAVVTLNDITERKRAEHEIRQLNVELEERVRNRTAQLEASNKELEAFSYSVSHDLRAPLRAVDGFSQAVLEDYGPQLPEEGRRYLQTIRDSAQRMGVLIDDLLTFSRLSRLPLNKQPIKLSSMVRDVLTELQTPQNGRKIDIRMGELAPCEGDPALLRQVWINFLSNALKYTRQRKEAVVEIGSKPDHGEMVYFVRDNGAGFDMRYAGKLFGVFQRLHRADEFEGTGVGLAIAQRVIQRHGGRVWAEGAVDRGATFYFTINEGNNV